MWGQLCQTSVLLGYTRIYGYTKAWVRSSVELNGQIFGTELGLCRDVNIQLAVAWRQTHHLTVHQPNNAYITPPFHVVHVDFLHLNTIFICPCCVHVQQVFATVLDSNCRSGYGSEPNRRQIGGLGRQYTKTVNWGTGPSTSPYSSEMGWFWGACIVGPSVNTCNLLAFAIRL